jgi:hypothetical protein
MRVVRLPAKTFMTVLAMDLVQSASSKKRRPDYRTRLLLDLLSILWSIASGAQDNEWERAIRKAKGSGKPEVPPALISARLAARDLVREVLRRAPSANEGAIR